VAVEDADEWATFSGTVAKLVNDMRSMFIGIDRELLCRELTALGLEIFSIAYARKVKVDLLSWRQSGFTRDYLEERGKLDIWEIMAEYNQVIGQSGMAGQDGDRVGDARDKMYRKWLKSIKKDRPLADEEKVVADDCVNRAANLIGAEMKQVDCVLAESLAARLMERLGQGIGLKRETLHKVAAIIFDFYRGAELYLKYINLHA
jgi:hypothetical protein